MRHHKLIFTIIMAVAALQAAAQQLTERYTRERPIAIVCDWDKAPYEFLDDAGQPDGINVVVLNNILNELKLPHTFLMKNWANACKAFEQGEADLILANVNRFKGKQYVSTQIINYNRLRVAMTRDTTGTISFSDLLKGRTVLKTGDYTANYFHNADTAEANRVEYHSPKVALTGLLAGDYKYFVWGEEPLKWKIKELNLKGIYLNDVMLPVSEVHIIGRDKELIDQIDDLYSRLKQSGQLEQIHDQWLHPEREHDSNTPIIAYILVPLLILAALIVIFNVIAKRHVKSVTRESSELNDMMYKAMHMGNFMVMQYDIAQDHFTNCYGSNILPEGGLTLEEFTQRIHPDQRSEFDQKMRQLITGRELRFELNKRWNNGTEEEPNWLIFNGHAILELDKDEHPAYIVNAIHDITPEMEEDKAERELEKKYDKLANLPLAGLSIYDKDGWLIDLNDRMREICNISSELPEAKRFWETICMFDIPVFHDIYHPGDNHSLMTCQHVVYPEFNLDKYIEMCVIPLLDSEGNVVNYVATALDITEERNRIRRIYQEEKKIKATKENIKLHLERLKYLLKHSDKFLMKSDMQQERISFYRSPETPEYVHSYSDFLGMMEEEEREPFNRLLHVTTTQEQQQCTIHLTERPEGQPGAVINIMFLPTLDAEGHIIGHHGISSDVTTIVTAREDMKKATQDADQSMQLKSGFMASMTHELRTPLNAIVGFTGVLPALEAEERAEYVRIIRNSTDMLQRLINDIIEASSMTDGPTNIELEEVDFAQTFDDICLMLQQRVQNPEVAFEKDNPYDLFITTLDRGRVQQVLTNFVTNAVKFTKKGHIRVGYRYENHGLYLYCEDTGIGIPKDKQDAVFERFVKLDEFVQGTGMGLAISKAIAHHCGGKIGVESEGIDGKGSTFWMWVPCEKQEI